jgi:hypothetical protein
MLLTLFFSVQAEGEKASASKQQAAAAAPRFGFQ